MAGKKAKAIALQIEVDTNEEWDELLKTPGLLVVDVYSNWSGPCRAMVSTLRKVKMEIGGDIVSYAMAKNDKIDALERFRGKSEPAWMFIQNGKMVNFFFGAHGPKMQRILTEEIRRVKQEEPPEWSLPVTERGPIEEAQWQKKEAIRKEIEDKKQAAEKAAKKAIYEQFMKQMMFELCEETALLLYPWVFRDEDGNQMAKDNSAPYLELKNDIFPECFDIAEEIRIHLDEDTIEKMFVESGVIITDELVEGLTEGRCMIIRLKGRPPHPDWPVPYPHPCEPNTEKCPIRQINDVENYLINIIMSQPPPLLSSQNTRMHFDEPFIQRHVYIHESVEESEEYHRRVYPAVWVPLQARSKVHVFKTIFSKYMEKNHPYEEPVPPLPLCAFKYESTKLAAVQEAYQLFEDYIKHFGAFEFDRPQFAKRLASTPQDFEAKVKYKTGNEVFVVILRRVNSEAFLSFAGIEPFEIYENNDEVLEVIKNYFSTDIDDFTISQDFPEDEDEEEEEDEYEDEEEEKEEQPDFGYGVVEY